MMIDLRGRNVLIVGGGSVASRRADTLLRCGAKVRAVSPKFSPEFPDDAERICRAFTPEDIDDDFCLVVSATDDRSINSEVHDLAKSHNIPVNVSDCQNECDFFFPSLVNEGCIGVSVNSAGTSSTLTRKLSDRLRGVWASWVNEANGDLC